MVVRKSAHEGSVRNASLDPHLEYLATTGCDGMLKITKIAGNEQKLIKNCKITTNKNIDLAGNQWLEMAWSPDGEHLYVAGDTQLLLFSRSDNFSKQEVVASISHPKEISHVCFVSNKCLVTASIDKFVKVWHLPSGPTGSKNVKLIAHFKSEYELMRLKYSSELKVLAFLDI